MYPVTGASGGATRRPHLRMPTMLVSRDPCHNNILSQSFNIITTVGQLKLTDICHLYDIHDNINNPITQINQ